jgi:hypothetical protein
MSDSLMSNYGDYYEVWNDSDTEECADCFGTGMDRDELYECAACYGEGSIPVINFKKGLDNKAEVG